MTRSESNSTNAVAPAVRDSVWALPPGSVKLRGPIHDKILQLKDVWFDDQTLAEMADVFRQRKNDFAIGEFWGKAVRALCRTHDYTQDSALRSMLEKTAADLISTQTPDGCISHRSTDTQPRECDLWGRKYALWGLESCHAITSDARILEAMKRMADRTLDQVGPAPKVDILDTGWHYQGIESSSILEPMLTLYRLTGEARYLAFANYIVDRGGCKRENIFEAVLSGKDVKDVTDNGNRIESLSKTYEMISNFEGLAEYYRMTGDERRLRTLKRFFANVIDTEITVIGSGGGLGLHNWWGRAAGELWNYSKHEQACPMCEGIEGCTAARWFAFCHHLLRLAGDPACADQMELTVHNALLGSIRPDGQRVDYHTNLNGTRPGATGYAMKFNGRHITCCVYNVVDAMASIPAAAVMRDGEGAVVNLYIPGTARVPLAGDNEAALAMDTDYPGTGQVRVHVALRRPERFAIRVRIPSWSRRSTLKVNGEPVTVRPGTYAKIERPWSTGDTIELDLDMSCRLICAPKGQWRLGEHHVALQRGPVVLARDKRLGQDVFEPVHVRTDADGTVALEESNPAVPARMQFDVPTEEGGSFPVVDFASAGGTWDEASEYCTWMPTRESPAPRGLLWIGPNRTQAVVQDGKLKAWFRGTVTIPNGAHIASARLAMAAEGGFACWINGLEVARTEELLAIRTVNVTPHLKPGRNVLAVAGVLPAKARFQFGNRGGIVGALRIDFRDGPVLTFMTDGNWRWAAKPAEGWERTEHDDSSWLPVETWSWKGTGISPWNLFDGLMCPA